MLSDILKARSGSGKLMPILDQQMIIEGKRDSENRKKGVFHPSSLGEDFCPREWVLEYRYPDQIPEGQWSADSEWTFAIGTEMHRFIQGLGGRAGVLYGWWESLCCRVKWWGGYGVCPKCGRGNDPEDPVIVYRELGVKDPSLGIDGHTDGVLWIDWKKYLLEFKTMRTDMFATLVKPLPRHRTQVLTYTDTLSRNWEQYMEWIRPYLRTGDKRPKVEARKELEDLLASPFSGAVVLYLNKDSGRRREFFLPYTQQVSRDLESTRTMLRNTWLIKDTKQLPPPLEMCPVRTAARARRCSMSSLCFEMRNEGR